MINAHLEKSAMVRVVHSQIQDLQQPNLFVDRLCAPTSECAELAVAFNTSAAVISDSMVFQSCTFGANDLVASDSWEIAGIVLACVEFVDTAGTHSLELLLEPCALVMASTSYARLRRSGSAAIVSPGLVSPISFWTHEEQGSLLALVA